MAGWRGAGWRAVAVLAAAATLAAACSSRSEVPATTTAATADPGSSSADPESASDGSADQPPADADGRDSREGDGDGRANGGDTGEAAANGQQGAENGSSAVAASDGAASEPAAPDGATPGKAIGGQQAAGGEAPEGDPETEPFVNGPTAPLTASITTDLSLAQRRPLAVKVGNGDPKDRPQAGLAAADIVYEVLVEAGKTRFLAVFHSEIPGRLGPVRSARSSDFQILEDLAAPYLATSGANSTVLREMRQAARQGTLVDVGAMRMYAPYERDRSRRAPHNLYFHYERLGTGDPASLPGGLPDAPPAPLFEYGAPNPPGLPDAAGVTVAYRALYGGESSHVWDPVMGGWVRIQDGTLHTTETDFGLGEIAPANVVVLSMPYGTSAADRRSPQALSYGAGRALVLTAGAVHEGSWERTEDRIGFRFRDTAGNPLSLSSGSTWLLLGNTSRRWPEAETTVLASAEATRMLADARSAADDKAGAAA